MNRLLVVLMVLLLTSLPSLGQDDVDPVADDATQEQDSIDALDVERELEEDRKKREAELAEYQEKLRLAEDKKAEVVAAIENEEKRVPDAEKKVEEHRQKKEDAFSHLSKTSLRYAEKEGAARETYQAEEIQKLHDKRWEIFSKNKKAHESDMAFIAENQWSTEDFKSLAVRMDPRDDSRVLHFNGRNLTAKGDVFVVSHEEGTRTWHRIPAGTKFTPIRQRSNNFVVDITIRPTRDALDTGATKSDLWNFHVYVAKHFRSREGMENRFELLGVSWFNDAGRPKCWMTREPPVFEPHPMPVFEAPDESTDEVIDLMKKWKFRDEGEIERLSNARNDVEVCKKNLARAERDVESTKVWVEKELKELGAQLEEADAEITEYKMIIKEYEDAILDAQRRADEEFGEDEDLDDVDPVEGEDGEDGEDGLDDVEAVDGGDIEDI